MNKSEHYCPFCCVQANNVERVGEGVGDIRITCDFCMGVYRIIQEVGPLLTIEEANLKFQGIPIVQKEDGRKGKRKKKE